MRYVMKQNLWSIGDDFAIKDEAGHDRFLVDGKALSLGDKLAFLDTQGRELAFVREKLLSWGPTYEIYHGGLLFAVVKEHLWSVFRNRFTVDVGADGAGPEDLEVEGDFFDREYAFRRGGRTVATVSRKFWSWADTYGVDVADGEDDVLILACAVVIDMITEKHKNR